MDAYERLRPYTDDASCDCTSVEQLLLVDIRTANPVRCFSCKGYVDPQTIALAEKQVEAVASWQLVFRALYDLWLDSGEYEAWAKQQLLRREGRVNTLGMAARASLAQTRPTFYWWFHDSDDAVPASCPCCAGTLVPAVRYGTSQCNSCWIMV